MTEGTREQKGVSSQELRRKSYLVALRAFAPGINGYGWKDSLTEPRTIMARK
jgi:hypothetical protein